jgi:hypothetical protein
MNKYKRWKTLIQIIFITQILLFPILFAYIPTLYINTNINFIIVGMISSCIISISTTLILDDLEGLMDILCNSSLISLPTPELTQGVFHWLGEVGINPVILYALIFEFLLSNLVYFMW